MHDHVRISTPSAPRHSGRMLGPRDMDPYAIAEYPDSSFHNAVEAQAVITSRMKITAKLVKVLWLSMFVTFLASLLCGVLAVPVAVPAGIGLMFILFIPTGILLLYAPAANCPQCGKRMRKDWAVIQSGRSAGFMICPACRIYLYTHRTLR